jgi:adenylate cyclase
LTIFTQNAPTDADSWEIYCNALDQYAGKRDNLPYEALRVVSSVVGVLFSVNYSNATKWHIGNENTMAETATLVRNEQDERPPSMISRLRAALPRRRDSGSQGPLWKKLLPGPVTLGMMALLLVAIGIRIADPTWVQILRVKTFDLYQIIKPREPIATQVGVAIVDIDERSLSSVGQWPWSRATIGDLILQIGKAGGVVVGFDAIFPEYDRTSPPIIADTIRGVDVETVNLLKSLPRNEDVMVEAMKQVRVVAGQAGQSDALPADRLPPSNKTSVKGALGGDPAPFLFRYQSMLGNVPEIETNASGHGFFSVVDEIDGIIRRVPLVAMVGEEKTPRPALTVEMLRAAYGGNGIFTKRDAAGMVSLILQLPRGQRFEIPTDGQGRIFVHFAKPDKFNTPDNSGRLYVSAGDVLNGNIGPNKLRGKLVVFGISATGLKDIRATPIEPRLPGVEVHANILETIIAAWTLDLRAKQVVLAQYRAAAEAEGGKTPTDQEVFKAAQPELAKIKQSQFYLRYPNFANAAEIAIMLLAGIAMIIFVPRVGPMWTLAGLVTATGGLSWLAWYLYSEKLILVDVTYPGAVTFTIYAVLTFSNYTREAAEKKKVRGAFGMYLSPDLVNQLAENPDQLKLGGETKQMTFLFCDVRGFTSISETFKKNPMGLTLLVNRFLTPLTEAILTRNGTIDKYMGDCIMAFWNAPIDDELHSEHACTSALAMFKELEVLNAAREKEAEEAGEEFLPLNVGIGINTGDCVVGNMGSERRFDYSVLGDPVNLAARLEGQSKNYGVKIVIGEDTANQVTGKFATLPLDMIAVKGKTEAVSIFTILGDADYVATPDFQKLHDVHSSMIEAYLAQDWDKSEQLSKECRTLDGGQMSEFYDVYEERFAEYRENPPGPDWDGVFIATTK